MHARRLASLLPVLLVAACAGSAKRATTVAPTVLDAATPQAMTLASAGLEPRFMDTAVDPCQDFFSYACGGFVKNEVIPPDHAAWGVGYEIAKRNEEFLRDVLEKSASSTSGDATARKLGDYYAACMDEDGIEKAALAPAQPLLDAAASVTSFATLTDAIAKLHASGVFAIFSVGSTQDFGDATKVVVSLDQDGLGLPDRDYYLKSAPDLRRVREFYVGHVGRMLGLAGFSPADVKTRVDDVMRIETKLARLQQDKVTRRDPYKVYHPVDRAGLASMAKTFPWDAYLATLSLPAAREITVNDRAYFAGIDALMHDEKPEAWSHYLGWRALSATAPVLPKAFVNEDFALRRELTGQKELPPRWKRCVRDLDVALGELLGQPYVAAKFAGDSKARASELTAGIRQAMRDNLATLAWMDDPTRAAALEKLEKVNAKVGYPDRWRTYDFEVSRASYAANYLAATRFELHRQLAKIGKPVDRAEWGMTPPTVNAYYNASLNEIVLPAGELQPPYFSKDFYPPVNIGNAGASTIGHELTHGFDDEGAQFDGGGNLRVWWTKRTKTAFDGATKCLQDQYSSYETVPGIRLNGALTAGENIADVGGVKLGYAALVSWERAHPEARRHVEGFTDEQLFFLGYAQAWCEKESPESLATHARTDPHSPARWRVNGPMVDVPAFATAFRCAAGTPMNTGKTCAVW
jgi:predicted metalloendopeptidase